MSIFVAIKSSKSDKTTFNLMLELAEKRDILIFNVNLPGNMDGHFYKDLQYKIILMDFNKLSGIENKENVLAFLLGGYKGYFGKDAVRFAKKLINLLKGDLQHGKTGR